MAVLRWRATARRHTCFTALFGALVSALLFSPQGAVAESVGTVTEFSSGITAASEPRAIAAGPDGNLWFGEASANKVGRITTTGTVTEFSAGLSPSSFIEAMTAGPDGNLWFTELGNNQVGRITPGGTITEFSSGISPSSGLGGITAGPDGNLWFTEFNGIGQITPAGTVTEFKGVTKNSAPIRITTGPDGNLWFTEFNAMKIGRITPAGAVTEFGGVTGSNPEGIASGPDGNVWFTEAFGNVIGRISPMTGTATELSGLSPASRPVEIVAGPDGNLWFTEYDGNRIGRITPSGAITEFSSGISPGANPSGIAVGADGNVWFTELLGNRIGRITTGAPPALVSGPTVSGGEQAGTPQVCNTPFWSSWAGQQPSASLYGFDGFRWLLDGSQIATGQSYTPSAADVGHQLACAETVTYPLTKTTTSTASAPVTVLAATVTPLVLQPTPLVISSASQSTSRWREGAKLAQLSSTPRHAKRKPPIGTTFTFSLSKPATVSFRFAQLATGRRVGHKCLATTHRNRRRRPCKRTVVTSLPAFAAHSGTNRLRFQGRISRAKKLRLGRYTLAISATNALGQRSRPNSLSFTIVK
jgi:streptogramin lyase